MGTVPKRTHKWGFFGKPQTEVGPRRWNGLSGLPPPISEERCFIENIKSGSLGTVEEVVNCLREINDNRHIYQQAWAYRMILKYYGINEISPKSDARIKQDYIEAWCAWTAEIKKDARKEFEMGDVDREVFEPFVNSLGHRIDFEN